VISLFLSCKNYFWVGISWAWIWLALWGGLLQGSPQISLLTIAMISFLGLLIELYCKELGRVILFVNIYGPYEEGEPFWNHLFSLNIF
jgi:hypothetical protein